jgi:hypothetical protein
MSTLTVQTISNGSVSTSSTNVIQGSAKSWVNFNGVTTATIRASYNVSSVTRSSSGLYVVNFTNAFTDANYATTVGASNNTTADSSWPVPKVLTQTTSAATISTPTFSNSGLDCVYVAIACFR